MLVESLEPYNRSLIDINQNNGFTKKKKRKEKKLDILYSI